MDLDATPRELPRRVLAQLRWDLGQDLRRRVDEHPTLSRLAEARIEAHGVGHEVGPDLATVRNRSPQRILSDIMMPSTSIAQNYESYVVDTTSSGTIEGVMRSQTPTTITIRHEEGRDDVIRRADIQDMRITNLSAMPADVDKQVSVDEMADLLAFLKGAR